MGGPAHEDVVMTCSASYLFIILFFPFRGESADGSNKQGEHSMSSQTFDSSNSDTEENEIPMSKRIRRGSGQPWSQRQKEGYYLSLDQSDDVRKLAKMWKDLALENL